MFLVQLLVTRKMMLCSSSLTLMNEISISLNSGSLAVKISSFYLLVMSSVMRSASSLRIAGRMAP